MCIDIHYYRVQSLYRVFNLLQKMPSPRDKSVSKGMEMNQYLNMIYKFKNYQLQLEIINEGETSSVVLWF